MIEIRAQHERDGEVQIIGMVHGDSCTGGWFQYRRIGIPAGHELKSDEFTEFSNLHRYSTARTIPGSRMP
jgi:hypothetical protein